MRGCLWGCCHSPTKLKNGFGRLRSASVLERIYVFGLFKIKNSILKKFNILGTLIKIISDKGGCAFIVLLILHKQQNQEGSHIPIIINYFILKKCNNNLNNHKKLQYCTQEHHKYTILFQHTEFLSLFNDGLMVTHMLLLYSSFIHSNMCCSRRLSVYEICIKTGRRRS